jgi:hypothetical protein
LVPVAVSVKSPLPAAIVVGLIVDRVGANTPLNPPHPHRTVRTDSNRKIGE